MFTLWGCGFMPGTDSVQRSDHAGSMNLVWKPQASLVATTLNQRFAPAMHQHALPLLLVGPKHACQAPANVHVSIRHSLLGDPHWLHHGDTMQTMQYTSYSPGYHRKTSSAGGAISS